MIIDQQHPNAHTPTLRPGHRGQAVDSLPTYPVASGGGIRSQSLTLRIITVSNTAATTVRTVEIVNSTRVRTVRPTS